jgi:hypothetical protein
VWIADRPDAAADTDELAEIDTTEAEFDAMWEQGTPVTITRERPDIPGLTVTVSTGIAAAASTVPAGDGGLRERVIVTMRDRGVCFPGVSAATAADAVLAVVGAEVEALRAENERLRDVASMHRAAGIRTLTEHERLQAGWTKAFDIAVSHQTERDAALAEVEQLKAIIDRVTESAEGARRVARMEERKADAALARESALRAGVEALADSYGPIDEGDLRALLTDLRGDHG